MSRLLRGIIPPLCALLLAAFPALSLFAHNQPELELSVLVVPLAASLAAALTAYLLAFLATRSEAKAGVLASLLVLSFFYYSLLSAAGRTWFLAGWLLLLVVGVVAALRTRRDLLPVTLVLAVAAAVMVAPPAAGIVAYRLRHPPVAATDARLWPAALERPAPATGARPDIYVLMPDDYARADVLQKYFHFDNSGFLRELEKRGFAVSAQDRSPYSYSELNMASMLNLDYLSKLPSVLGKGSQDFTTVKRLMADSRAARLLTSAGYDYVHLDTDEVTFSGGNPHISALAPPDSFRSLWLSKTILSAVGGRFGFTQSAKDARFRASVHAVFAQLKALRPGPRPKLVVFHTLMPHDPFVFDAQGRPVTFPAGADHTGAVGMAYYKNELEFLNRQLLDAVDAIRAHAATPPVIVLQGDEGFEVNPDLVGENAARDIRVKGFGAFLLPGPGAPGVPEPPNMVNNLRLVFNRYLGTHYAMLPSVSHIEGDLPYDFRTIDVR